MSGRTLAYEPARRAEVFALLDRVRGYELDPAEFDWWFDGNPVGPRTIALAEEDERVVGVLGASHYRAVVGGREEIATLPLWAVTDPAFQGRGIFQRLNGEVERAARETGAALELGFTNKLAGPIYIAKLGWLDVARLRIWARPLLPGRGGDDGERLERFGAEQEGAYRALRDRLPSHFVRDIGLPQLALRRLPARVHVARVAERVRGRRAQAVSRRRHCVRRRPRRPDVPRDAPAASGAACARRVGRARCSRCFPQCMRRAYVSAGFVPTPETIRLIGHALDQGALPLGPKAWHFTLGDTDYF